MITIVFMYYVCKLIYHLTMVQYLIAHAQTEHGRELETTPSMMLNFR